MITILYQENDELGLDKDGEGLNLSIICVIYLKYFEDRVVGSSSQLDRCAVTALYPLLSVTSPPPAH